MEGLGAVDRRSVRGLELERDEARRREALGWLEADRQRALTGGHDRPIGIFGCLDDLGEERRRHLLVGDRVGLPFVDEAHGVGVDAVRIGSLAAAPHDAVDRHARGEALERVVRQAVAIEQREPGALREHTFGVDAGRVHRHLADGLHVAGIGAGQPAEGAVLQRDRDRRVGGNFDQEPRAPRVVVVDAAFGLFVRLAVPVVVDAVVPHALDVERVDVGRLDLDDEEHDGAEGHHRVEEGVEHDDLLEREAGAVRDAADLLAHVLREVVVVQVLTGFEDHAIGEGAVGVVRTFIPFENRGDVDLFPVEEGEDRARQQARVQRADFGPVERSLLQPALVGGAPQNCDVHVGRLFGDFARREEQRQCTQRQHDPGRAASHRLRPPSEWFDGG